MYVLCCVHTKRKENIIVSGEQVVAAGCHGNYSGETRNNGSGVNRDINNTYLWDILWRSYAESAQKHSEQSQTNNIYSY